LNYSDLPKYNNPFHLKEYYKEEFIELIHKYFKNLTLFHQKFVMGSLIINEFHSSLMKEYNSNVNEITENNITESTIYQIVLASDITFDSNLTSFFNYKHYHQIQSLDSRATKFKSIYYTIGKGVLSPVIIFNYLLRWLKRLS
jgi:hypothetical protein